jgi:hypothetical protein
VPWLTTGEFLVLYGQMILKSESAYLKAPIYVQAIAPVTAVRRGRCIHSKEKSTVYIKL